MDLGPIRDPCHGVRLAIPETTQSGDDRLRQERDEPEWSKIELESLWPIASSTRPSAASFLGVSPDTARRILRPDTVWPSPGRECAKFKTILRARKGQRRP